MEGNGDLPLLLPSVGWRERANWWGVTTPNHSTLVKRRRVEASVSARAAVRPFV